MSHTPNLPTNILPTNIARLKLSGKSPMEIRIPPPLTEDCAWVKLSKVHNVSRGIGRKFRINGS